MLRKKLDEVVSYNSTRTNPHIGESYTELGEPSRMANKERRYRCFICREKGHIASKCTNKTIETNPDSFETTNMDTTPTNAPIETPQQETPFKYEPTTVHVSTDYLIEGSDLGSWDSFWYVSTSYKQHMTPMKCLFRRMKQRFKVEGTEEEQRKFIVSYGVGEAVIETHMGRLLIPNVVYTPEITLNVLSLEQLKNQGYYVSLNGNKAKVWYMFDHMYVDTNSPNQLIE